MFDLFIDNLREEIRSDFVVSEKRKSIWNVEIGLLVKLDSVCKKYNLRYWLDGGSLLGAVRHHGFIPWDDDIDIVMPRKDYDKLSSIAKSEFCFPFFYQDIYAENNYPGIHAKLRDCRTTAIAKNWLFNDICQGIFIDIFPMDGVPQDRSEFDMLANIAYQKSKSIRFYYEYERILSLNPRIRKLLNSRKYKARKIVGDGKDYVRAFQEYENMFKVYDYDKSQQVGPIAFTLETKRQIAFDHKLYDETIFVNFESINVPIPVGFDSILKTYYGEDYFSPHKGSLFNTTFYFDPYSPYKKHIVQLRKEYSFINRCKKALFSFFKKECMSEYEKDLLIY